MMLNQLTFCKMVLQRFGMHENHSNHLELIFSTFTEIYRTRPGNSLRHFPACHWPWLLLWLWCVFRGMRECLSVEEYVSVLSLCPSLTPHRQNRAGEAIFPHWWDKSLNKNNTRNMGLFGSQWEGSIPPGRKEQLLTLCLRSASGEVNTGAQFTFFLLFSPGPELMEGNCPCLGQTFLSQLT